MTEKLREASVIIPHRHRNGGPGDVIRRNLLKDAARIFSGYTEIAASGGWLDSQGRLIAEPVSVVLIAAPDTVPGNALVQAFAARVGHDLDQDEVYCRYTDGEVILINRECWKAIFDANGGIEKPLILERPIDPNAAHWRKRAEAAGWVERREGEWTDANDDLTTLQSSAKAVCERLDRPGTIEQSNVVNF